MPSYNDMREIVVVLYVDYCCKYKCLYGLDGGNVIFENNISLKLHNSFSSKYLYSIIKNSIYCRMSWKSDLI